MKVLLVKTRMVAHSRSDGGTLREPPLPIERQGPCRRSPPTARPPSASASSAPRSRSSPRRATTAPPSPTSSAVPACRSAPSTRTSRARTHLFLSSCDLVAEQGLEELGLRLAPLTTTEARLHAAIDYYVETVDAFDGGPGPGAARRRLGGGRRRAGRPRAMLVRRRERLVGAATLLLQEGIARGDLPATRSTSTASRAASSACSTGCSSSASRPVADHRPADLARRANAVLDVLLAAARVPSAATPA